MRMGVAMSPRIISRTTARPAVPQPESAVIGHVSTTGGGDRAPSCSMQLRISALMASELGIAGPSAAAAAAAAAAENVVGGVVVEARVLDLAVADDDDEKEDAEDALLRVAAPTAAAA